MSWRRADEGGDSGADRELEVSSPFADAGELDALEYGDERRPWLGRALAVVAIVAVTASVTVSIVVPYEKSVERRHNQQSYDQLLSLSAAGEAAVERAESHTRDVVQFAEPLLNSSMTAPAVRTQLFEQINTAAKESSSWIDEERDRLAADSATRSGRLKVARAATLAYLSDWSALFAQAGGGGGSLPTDELSTERVTAQMALVAAAPDPQRAAEAGTVLGQGFG